MERVGQRIREKGDLVAGWTEKRRQDAGGVGQTDENKKEIGVSSIDKYKKEVNGMDEADENKNKTGGGIESKRKKGASWAGQTEKMRRMIGVGSIGKTEKKRCCWVGSAQETREADGVGQNGKERGKRGRLGEEEKEKEIMGKKIRMRGREAEKSGGAEAKMTERELWQLQYLNTEVEMYERQIERLEALAEASVVHVTEAKVQISGHSDKVGEYAVRLAALREKLEASRLKRLAEWERLEAYISGVEDGLIRQILQLRFVEGLSWQQVATGVGGRNTQDSVRKACRRHLGRG
ncbi:MAG: hypothetical protein ACOXZ0_05310 [Eubacteriales bacterium]